MIPQNGLHMIFPNVSGVVTIFFQSFCNGYCFAGNILSLIRTFELSLLFGYAIFVSIETVNNIDPIIDSCGVLTESIAALRG